MAELKTAQQQFREQFQVAENAMQSALRTWNEVATATTDIAFDLAQKNMEYGQQVMSKWEESAIEAVGTYRHVYQEAIKAWQSYVEGMSDMVVHSFDTPKQ